MKNNAPNKSPAAAMPAINWLLLDNQMCFALYSASLTMTKVYKPLLQKLGLTYPQYLVMLVMWEHDGCSVSQLGERLFLDSGTLTPLLKRLEADALIARMRDTSDERCVIVTLTSAGRKLQKQAQAIPQKISCASGCSLPELAALTSQLVDLRAALRRNIGITSSSSSTS